MGKTVYKINKYMTKTSKGIAKSSHGASPVTFCLIHKYCNGLTLTHDKSGTMRLYKWTVRGPSPNIIRLIYSCGTIMQPHCLAYINHCLIAPVCTYVVNYYTNINTKHSISSHSFPLLQRVKLIIVRGLERVCQHYLSGYQAGRPTQNWYG